MTRWQGYIAIGLLFLILARLDEGKFNSYLFWVWGSFGVLALILGLIHLSRETYKEALEKFTIEFEDVEPSDDCGCGIEIRCDDCGVCFRHGIFHDKNCALSSGERIEK